MSDIVRDTAAADKEHAAYLGRTYFPGLDGIRCFAVLAVIWHHSRPLQGPPIYERGHFGVDLFFVLSGFLISTLLIRERERVGRISLRRFWARRALRLMPAYYLLLFIMGAGYMLVKPEDEDALLFFRSLPIYALYLSNWNDGGVGNLNHTWTLSTEEQFYVLWPLVEGFARPLTAGLAWVAAFAANQLMNFGLLDETLRAWGLMGEGRSEIAQVTFAPILLGVAVAHLLHSPAGYRGLRRLGAWPGAPLVYAALIVFLLSLKWVTLDGAPRLVLHVLATLLVLSIVLSPGGSSSRFLEFRPIRYLGTVSYGMYLYHMLCVHVAAAAVGGPESPAMFPATLALTVCAAAISYWAFEARLLALRTRFRAAPAPGRERPAVPRVPPQAPSAQSDTSP